MSGKYKHFSLRLPLMQRENRALPTDSIFIGLGLGLGKRLPQKRLRVGLDVYLG